MFFSFLEERNYPLTSSEGVVGEGRGGGLVYQGYGLRLLHETFNL